MALSCPWVRGWLILILASGCGPPEPPLASGCNPLGGGPAEDCLLPFPSSYYTRPDNTSPTGLRVNLPRRLPASIRGLPYDPAPFNLQDGFSPATTLLAYFPPPPGSPPGPLAIDGSLLPGPARIEASLQADSPAQVLRFDTGERVPIFAELDENADPSNGERQALILRPVVRLQGATRYVAAVRGLRAQDGTALAPLSGFAALRDDRVPDSSPRAGERARFAEIFSFLARAGLAREDLQLAWDFTTASDGSITGRLVKMRDAAQAYQAPSPPPPVTLTEVIEHPAGMEDLLLQVNGTFAVPSFLTEDLRGRLRLGPSGEPQIRGHGQFPLVLHVPDCARAARLPLPVLLYGHGSFGTAAAEMSTPYQRQLINRLCMVQVGTDWIGRAQGDVALEKEILADWNNLAISTERLQQAHLNFLTLARLIKSGGLNALPSLRWGGKPLVDGTRLYYLGISEGGIQGGTLMALTPDIQRGALNAACGFWSLFFWRSSDDSLLLPLLSASYRDPLDRQVLVALSQSLWDYTDPASYAPHLLSSPLPGSVPKRILYQEGINDASVPNQDTRAMARTIGLPLLRPRVEAVFGVPEAPAPQPSAYVQFDVGWMPRLGGDDVPPAVTPVHEALRSLPAVEEQLRLFLREGGQVEDTCQGKPCVFPLSP